MMKAVGVVFVCGLACGAVAKMMITKAVDKVVVAWLEKEARRQSKTEKDSAAK